MYKIYIVEDDPTIADVLVKELEKWGYSTSKTSDFELVVEEIKKIEPHVILLDINLPYQNGFYWCEEIRKFSQTPILFISSANDNMSMITAMYQGADDFIAKPFHLNVLVAKIKALIRRTYEFGADTSKLYHKNMVLDLEKNTVKIDEHTIEITKNEFLILKTLTENKGRIVSRSALIEFLWESEEFIDDNTLNVNISRLRKKLEENGLANFILTKKGVGYLIDA